MAAQLAADGWRVFATMRDPIARASLDRAIGSVGADTANLTVLPLDVRSRESIAAAAAAVFTRTGDRLDALIACAGILVAGPFEETPLEAMRSVMEVNYFGVIETVRATLPGLRAAGGRIILVSSDSGFCGTARLVRLHGLEVRARGVGRVSCRRDRTPGSSLVADRARPVRQRHLCGGRVPSRAGEQRVRTTRQDQRIGASFARSGCASGRPRCQGRHSSAVGARPASPVHSRDGGASALGLQRSPARASVSTHRKAADRHAELVEAPPAKARSPRLPGA